MQCVSRECVSRVRCVLFFFLLIPGAALAADAEDDASFVGYRKVPSTMTAGDTREVIVWIQNKGDSTWTASDGFALASENPPDNATWGLSSVPVEDDATVEPRVLYSFVFTITAPSTPGEYAFQWRMANDGIRFGPATGSRTIAVTPPPNDAAFASYRGLPDSMTAGETANVGVTMRNTGTSAWTGDAWKLASRNEPPDLWGVGQVGLPEGESVSPNNAHSFTFAITAPRTPGDHAFQWRMERDGVAFGSTTTSRTIAVKKNASPVVALALDDMTLTVGGRSKTVDLSLHFEDPEREALTFSASSADPAAVSASVTGHLLTVAAAAEGAVVVKVTATDAFGSPSAAAAFTVTAQPPVDVHIPDANLRACVERELRKQPGAPIDSAEMERMSSLDGCEGPAIEDLTGLEFATGLALLKLWGNAITDVTPLSGLAELEILRLGFNAITDVSPLSGLAELSDLDLQDNAITDVSPLSSLAKLTLLDLWDNEITDVSPLSGLAELESLALADNAITDLGPLSGLTKLTSLLLNGNEITDVSPLSGLTELYELWIWDNDITDVSPLSGIAELSYLWISDNDITDVSPLSGLPKLYGLNLADNAITDVSPLAGLAGLASLDLDGNCLTSIGGLTSNAGLGDGDWVSLEWNPLDARTLAEDVTALRERGVTVAVSEAPSGALGAPRDLHATAGDGELTIAWVAPPGPAKPVAYELRWRSAAGAFDDWAVVPCSSKRRHELTGLANGTTYTVEVRAAGAAENGVATTRATPGAP